MTQPKSDRRPIKARSTRWAEALARAVGNAGVTPNQVSILSMVFAAIGAGLMVLGGWTGLVGAALCIQMRLICNLIDGMVAIEGGKQSPTGAVFNELPDRLSDTILIVAGGIAVGQPELGWGAALLGVLGAYIRTLGASLGVPHDFLGVMDKARRMGLLTVGLIAQVIELLVFQTSHSLLATLILLTIGTAATCIGRSARLLRRLDSQ